MIDALVCCLIVTVLASITNTVIKSHYHIHEDILEVKEDSEQKWEEYYEKLSMCTPCTIEEDSY